MPGRHGDILWSLPTARAIAEKYEMPVDFVLSQKYGSLLSLILRQEYIGSVTVDPTWEVQETAPMTPRVPTMPLEADRVYHLGYEGWPQAPLPFDVAKRAGVTIDLLRPWITASYPDFYGARDVVYGWSDEYFELKYGVTLLQHGDNVVITAQGSRWQTEHCHKDALYVETTDWEWAANRIASTKVFVGCCSALHVLAVAMGKRCVLMESNPQRHHPIFWPQGMDGPLVRIVRGLDGQPTWDSRHVKDAITAALAEGSCAK